MSRSYVLVLAAAGLCYAALGSVLRILPDHVGADLGGSAAAVGLAVGAPALTAIAARPLGGWAADRVGPKPIVLAGAVVMAAGTAPAFGSGGLAALDLSRLLVGAGEGAMMAATALWLLRLAGPDRRGAALGHIGLANYAGLAVGPLVADALSGSADPVFAAAALLPLLGAAMVLGIAPPPPAEDQPRPAAAREPGAPRPPSLLRATLRPGIGLALVNVGYVAVISFGTTVARGHGAAAAGLIVPVFAITVIGGRLLGSSLPDRLGAVPTLRACVLAEGLGLGALAIAHGSVVALAATIVLAAGQSLAVPALGIMAIARVEPERHGAAAGLFFSWFDAGVGLGGPTVGAAARALDPAAAIALSGAAVLSVGAIVVPPWRRTATSRAPATLRA
ncbi:MAG TPA: MFS transporter [Baekduia sp.]|jgi:predicted MFS family arabinose efflux permease